MASNHAGPREPPEVFPRYVLVVSSVADHIADSTAVDDFLDMVTALLTDNDMGFIGQPEQVVETTHDFLIGPNQQQSNVVGLAGEWMDFEDFLDILEIDELIDVTIRIARQIDECRVVSRGLVELVNRHYWEELVDRPVIENGTKDGKIAKVFRGEDPFKLFKLFFLDLGNTGKLGGAGADLPKEDLALGPVLEADQAEVELGVKLVLMVKRIVIVLAVIL